MKRVPMSVDEEARRHLHKALRRSVMKFSFINGLGANIGHSSKTIWEASSIARDLGMAPVPFELVQAARRFVRSWEPSRWDGIPMVVIVHPHLPKIVGAGYQAVSPIVSKRGKTHRVVGTRCHLCIVGPGDYLPARTVFVFVESVRY